MTMNFALYYCNNIDELLTAYNDFPGITKWLLLTKHNEVLMNTLNSEYILNMDGYIWFKDSNREVYIFDDQHDYRFIYLLMNCTLLLINKELPSDDILKELKIRSVLTYRSYDDQTWRRVLKVLPSSLNVTFLNDKKICSIKSILS